ncbi:ribonuclease HII [Mycoplasmopsis lipofaciens]|uniref:ribonuclease HII n=1 Tax=Mycoplasmopsis lipofaciens TaxID=114884 RepID=UPI0004895874|nr:ribonuclease HII [Mycoplasmopsis lipofaciens]
MLNFEQKLENKYKIIAGFDEAGRGCCAGPLVIACVVFPKNYRNDNINDSKKISAKQRIIAFDQIISDCIEYHIEILSPKQVDEFNPKQASRIGMKNCLNKLKCQPDLLITDFEKIETLKYEQINLIKGDQKAITVAAASILAKVTRDNIMIELSKKYKNFDFAKHKGYCTKQHQEEMRIFGITNEHRKSYKNVQKILKI